MVQWNFENGILRIKATEAYATKMVLLLLTYFERDLDSDPFKKESCIRIR